MYFSLCWAFVAARAWLWLQRGVCVGVVVASLPCSVGLLTAAASRCRARALGSSGFRSCGGSFGTWAQWLWLLSSRAQAQ